ncbi:MAG: dihydroorotate dehydrogenase electron transfer subunit [Chlorobiaceae bacterium]|nr:dihydroorotate dehydrogenase electron transfer subunit [Chlorobiaceae bacterium]
MLPSSFIIDVSARITNIRPVGKEVSVISLACPAIAANALPGNFVNIKVNASLQPLLRRPFCIHNVHGDFIDIMVKNVGLGTSILCEASCDTHLLVLGPLGNSFGTETDDFDTALLVSGGIGTAPMLFLEKTLASAARPFHHLVGGRSHSDLLLSGLTNVRTATDDGSEGFRGNVVELLEKNLAEQATYGKVKVFACGPNPMLKALARFCRERTIACELSHESIMGCGVGICYGCMVELLNAEGQKESILLCREGPVIEGHRFSA